ncbi:MAG: lysophospholipid acyltransferase family protein, partial [Oryzihumus sp.]
PAVVASNHIGFLDFAFVGYAARRPRVLVRFMAKQSTCDNVLSGPAMRAMGHIPVDRGCGAVAARTATRRLRTGEVVGVFPEATISRSWTLKPFKPGAAWLAVREQVPLIPVVTWGGHRVLTVDGHIGPRRGTAVTVLVGPPIATTGRTPAQVDAELRARLQELLDEATAGYPDRPRHDRDRWWLPRHLHGTAPTPEEAAVLDAEAVARVDSRAVRSSRR